MWFKVPEYDRCFSSALSDMLYPAILYRSKSLLLEHLQKDLIIYKASPGCLFVNMQKTFFEEYS